MKVGVKGRDEEMGRLRDLARVKEDELGRLVRVNRKLEEEVTLGVQAEAELRQNYNHYKTTKLR